MGNCRKPSQKDLMISSIPHRGHCFPHFQRNGLEGPGACLTRKGSRLEPGTYEGPHLWLQLFTPHSGEDSGSSQSRDDQCLGPGCHPDEQSVHCVGLCIEATRQGFDSTMGEAVVSLLSQHRPGTQMCPGNLIELVWQLYRAI